MLALGETVMGSPMTPLSNFFTASTCPACSSAVMFLWMMPMPPSWAMAMASRRSVTVSMAAETSGMLRAMSRVRRVSRRASRGKMLE